MARKKLSEMTPYERVEQRLVGLTNEQVEDIAIKMLAQTTAKAVYARNDVHYIERIMERICCSADEYAKEHAFELALAKIANREMMELREGVYLHYFGGKEEQFDGENDKSGVTGISVYNDGMKVLIGTFDFLDENSELDHVLSEYEPIQINDDKHLYSTYWEDACKDCNGEDNTQHIMLLGSQLVLPQNMYIPSVGECMLILKHIEKVQEALEYIGGAQLSTDEMYATSTEQTDSSIWLMRVSTKNFIPFKKTIPCRLRLAFSDSSI